MYFLLKRISTKPATKCKNSKSNQISLGPRKATTLKQRLTIYLNSRGLLSEFHANIRNGNIHENFGELTKTEKPEHWIINAFKFRNVPEEEHVWFETSAEWMELCEYYVHFPQPSKDEMGDKFIKFLIRHEALNDFQNNIQQHSACYDTVEDVMQNKEVDRWVIGAFGWIAVKDNACRWKYLHKMWLLEKGVIY